MYQGRGKAFRVDLQLQREDTYGWKHAEGLQDAGGTERAALDLNRRGLLRCLPRGRPALLTSQWLVQSFGKGSRAAGWPDFRGRGNTADLRVYFTR